MSSHNLRLKEIAIAAMFGVALGIGATPTKVEAADLGPSFIVGSPPRTAPVAFGTGWYIRGDLAYAHDSMPNINDFGFFPNTSAFRNTYSVGLGAGYKFNQWFRADITGDYREPLSATDPTTNTNANGGRWDVLANGYVDLGDWDGFIPYIGAGIGAAWGRAKITTKDSAIPCTQGGTIVCDSEHIPVSLAWSLMAGFAYKIFPHAYLDIGYRYLNLGTYSFYDSSLWSSYSAAVGMPADMQSHVHEFRIGLRYMID